MRKRRTCDVCARPLLRDVNIVSRGFGKWFVHGRCAMRARRLQDAGMRIVCWARGVVVDAIVKRSRLGERGTTS